MAKDITISLEDRPGTLAEVGEALGGAGVNIDGICGFPAGGRGMLHALVEDAGAARAALEGTGAQVEDEREVVVLDIEDRPGALGEITRRIADAGANVDLVYLSAGGKLVLSGGDVEAIRSAT